MGSKEDPNLSLIMPPMPVGPGEPKAQPSKSNLKNLADGGIQGSNIMVVERESLVNLNSLRYSFELISQLPATPEEMGDE